MNAGEIAPGPLLKTLLFIPGGLYQAGVRTRNSLYDWGAFKSRSLPAPAIGIGNLTVGGTGKTPLTSYATAALVESGYRVGVVSRGYGRRDGASTVVVSDGRSLQCDAARAGDEAYLVARDNPAAGVVVGGDRLRAAMALHAVCAPEVYLLDDAYQHRAAARDLNLLLVDGKDPWGNGKMLPFGPLREPLSGLKRADAIVVTRSDGSCSEALARALARHNPKAPIFHASIEPRRFTRADSEPVDLASLKGFAAYAFSGIAHPGRFEADLARLGLTLAGVRRFPDHHAYDRRELEAIAGDARSLGAEIAVTTEKDLVRIDPGSWPGPPLFALALGVGFPHGPDLTGFLLDRLRASIRRPGGGAVA